MKLISIVTPCYNEEGNVRLLSSRVKKIFDNLPDYDYEHIFADNCSEDNTLNVLKEMALDNKKIKIIANAKNFGPVKSLFNAILAVNSNAVVILAADLQDPPEMISQFIEKWREGYQVVFGIREKRAESKIKVFFRKAYYRLLQSISEDTIVKDAGDFVLFDKEVLKVLKSIKDTNPYIRGLLSSLGFRHTGIKYHMQRRHAGKTSANLFSLFVYALNGFMNHTLFPLRLATFVGFLMAFVCIVFAFIQLLLKLVFWQSSAAGIPTLTVGLFFMSGVQLFLIGFLGEFIGSIYKQLKGLPPVIEKERINFEKAGSDDKQT
jgi:glycosyltransferase involved in cell wall biosynthesis